MFALPDCVLLRPRLGSPCLRDPVTVAAPGVSRRVCAVPGTLWTLDPPRFSGGFGRFVLAGRAPAASEGQPRCQQHPSSRSRAGTPASPAGALRGPCARVTFQKPPEIRRGRGSLHTEHRTPPRPGLSPLGLSPHVSSCGHRGCVLCCLGADGPMDRQTASAPEDTHRTRARPRASRCLLPPRTCLPFSSF